MMDRKVLDIISSNQWITKPQILEKLNLSSEAYPRLGKALNRLERDNFIMKRYSKQVKTINKINRILKDLPPFKTSYYIYQYKVRVDGDTK